MNEPEYYQRNHRQPSRNQIHSTKKRSGLTIIPIVLCCIAVSLLCVYLVLQIEQVISNISNLDSDVQTLNKKVETLASRESKNATIISQQQDTTLNNPNQQANTQDQASHQNTMKTESQQVNQTHANSTGNSTTDTRNNNNNNQMPNTQDAITTHTVVSGESLSIISDEYGVSLEKLLTENNLNIDDYLTTGQQLIIPTN